MKKAESPGDIQVPRLALRLLRWAGGREHYDSALGDLMETFAYQVDKLGSANARRWFFREVIRGIPGFLLNGLYWRIAMLRNYIIIFRIN